jgi:Domain of unknown function (DUF5618)
MTFMRERAAPGEALRYLRNARAILRHLPVERDIYLDRKPVREAMVAAYLAVLEAINEALSRRGVARKELPKSVEAFRAALQRHLATRNGTLMREFESLYDLLHIAGYYRGLLYDRTVVRGALDAAQRFIEKVA